MDTKRKGNITEMETMLAFMKLGYNVLTPYGDCERYDFVVDIGNKFIRVQSKTASTENNGASFKISTSSSNRKDGGVVHHTYTKEDIDYFTTVFDGIVYLFPVEICGGRDKQFRIEPTKNGQVRGITWAKDYVLSEVIKTI